MEVVIVDSREPKYIPDQLQAYGFTVAVDTLDAGDYLFFPHQLKVLIERKRIDDLLNSLRDGRMVSQAHKMTEQSDAAILLVEGKYDRAPSGIVTYEINNTWVESGWSWDSFSGMLLDLKWMGLIHHQCMMGDATREIARIVGSLCKEEHSWIKSRERPTIISIDPQYRNNMWSLMAWDGVGQEWAAAILQTAGTFEGAVNMPVDELAEVKNSKGKRFGGKRAAALKQEWTTKW